MQKAFCFRAKRAGFTVKTCLSAKLWHKVSASFTSKAHSTYFWWRNRLYWIERNCTPSEKKELFQNVLRKEIFHLWKIKTIKTFEIFMLTRLLGKKPPFQKVEKLHKYRAAWQGIQDNAKGRFGQGPSWIYTKHSELSSKYDSWVKCETIETYFWKNLTHSSYSP